MLQHFTGETIAAGQDVCIVGAGPAGIALALACEDRGLSVLLLESGQQAFEDFPASLGAGHAVDAARHAAPTVAMARVLGGTSLWWGGRCVPFDAADFAPRPHSPEAAWPVIYDDVARWYPQAAAFFGIGPAQFEAPIAPWSTLRGVRFADLERWCPAIDMAGRHRRRLEASQRITVLLGATVTGITLSDAGDRATGLSIANQSAAAEIAPRRIVLACGGLETTRLLLASRQRRPEAFGGPDGALGRYYMGHLSGKIANLVLADPAEAAAHDFALQDGAFVRRRFTFPAEVQSHQSLPNISFWADNPPFHAAEHRSGMLSAVWMALAMPPVGRRLVSEGVRLSHVGPRPHKWLSHAWNVLRSPFATVGQIVKLIRARYLSSPRSPGFLIRNAGGRYALHYHAEQSPNRQSTVTLSDRRDPLGMPFLDVDLRFREDEARAIVRAHELLDAALREAKLGRLDFYEAAPEHRIESVLRQATDGFHQIGTTRMGDAGSDSVVDGDGKVHGVDNLFVASSSVFPSSGQANPTFLVVALALRLAEHLRRLQNDTSDDPVDAVTRNEKRA